MLHLLGAICFHIQLTFGVDGSFTDNKKMSSMLKELNWQTFLASELLLHVLYVAANNHNWKWIQILLADSNVPIKVWSRFAYKTSKDFAFEMINKKGFTSFCRNIQCPPQIVNHLWDLTNHNVRQNYLMKTPSLCMPKIVNFWRSRSISDKEMRATPISKWRY